MQQIIDDKHESYINILIYMFELLEEADVSNFN